MTLRIALVSELLPDMRGGLLNHVHALAEAFVAAGHHVTLVGRKGEPPQGIPVGTSYQPLIPPGERGWKERKAGVIIMDRRRPAGVRIKRVLRHLLKTNDIVHYHGHNIAAIDGLPQRVFFTSHDYAGICPKKTLFSNGDECATVDAGACAPCYLGRNVSWPQQSISAWQVRRWRRMADRASRRTTSLFVSEAQRQLWRKYASAGVGDRSKVVPNFLSRRQINHESGNATRSKYGLSVTSPMLLLASVDQDYKGISSFLTAMSQLETDVVVVVAGGHSVETSTAIRSVGWLERGDLMKLMAAADVFCIPSLWPDPCPTTVYEAVLSGTQVVGMRRGGLAEMARSSGGWVAVADTTPELARMAARTAETAPPTDLPPATFFQRQTPEVLISLYHGALQEDGGETPHGL